MSSTFAGLSGALSALNANRVGLDVTGQNIANANTEGYTRQRVDLAAVPGTTTVGAGPAAWGGGGVAVAQVTRLRDDLLDARSRAAHAGSGYIGARQAVFDQVEQLVAE